MPIEREIAEIEAVLREHLDCEDGAVGGIYQAAVVIAALRAKDREGGAREMRERAAALCDEAMAYFTRTTGHYDRDQAAGSYRATATKIRALAPARTLPLTPKESGDA